MTLDIEAIKRRANAATAGPWTDAVGAHPSGDNKRAYVLTDPPDFADAVMLPPTRENAIFVARAREDIPALVAEVEALRAMLKRVQFAEQIYGDVGEVCNVCHGEYEHTPECELAHLLK